MNKKKFLAIIGIILAVGGMILAAANVITWRLFWIIAILVAGFAYFLLPRMSD
jgi:hypothetical protein